MKKLNAIIFKEWANFIGSERGVFAVYGVLVLSWSFLPLYKGIGAGVEDIWWLFFSVVISGVFSNTVFVSERLSGSMEILLTSGFSRDAVLFGKAVYTIFMSILFGAACMGLSRLWLTISGGGGGFDEGAFYGAGLYCAGTCMNVAIAAWLSVRLQSPRLIPIVTILLMTVIVAGFSGLLYFVSVPQWSLHVLILLIALAFFLLARKEFNGERIIQPIHL
jgi:ABC-type transport system involved in multi-copper enzyme maturation permease subunit